MTSELFAAEYMRTSPGTRRNMIDGPLADGMKDPVPYRAVGDEARELVNGVLDAASEAEHDALDHLVERLADEPEDDEGGEDHAGVEPDPQHARVHPEEAAGLPKEELVVERDLQLMTDEALVRRGERRHEEQEERGRVGEPGRCRPSRHWVPM